MPSNPAFAFAAASAPAARASGLMLDPTLVLIMMDSPFEV
jgi:hypothetical protein